MALTTAQQAFIDNMADEMNVPEVERDAFSATFTEEELAQIEALGERRRSLECAKTAIAGIRKHIEQVEKVTLGAEDHE